MTDNRHRRYKPSPLQQWKIEYRYVSGVIYELKQARRLPWSRQNPRQKVFRSESRLTFMQQQARDLLESRPFIAQISKALWEANSREAAEGKDDADPYSAFAYRGGNP